MLAGVGALAVGGAVVGANRTSLMSDEPSKGTEFDGLDHQPLGDATLSTEDGSLVASNVDGDGDDGFATDTRRSVSWHANAGSTMTSMPVGSSITVEAYGTADGNPGMGLGSMTMTRNESTIDFTASYMSTTMSGDVAIEVMDGDTSRFYDSPNDTTYQVAIYYDPWWWDWIWWDFAEMIRGGAIVEGNSGRATPNCLFGIHNANGDTVPMTVNDQEVQGDRLRVIETSSGHDHEVWYTTEMRTTAAGVDPITLDAEPIEAGAMFGGLAALSRGDASVQRSTDTLTVGGVDAGDGFGIVLGAVDGVDVAFEGIDPDADDAELTASATGAAGDSEDAPLGSAGLSDQGDSLGLTADFRALGASTVRAEVLNDGGVAGSGTAANGTVGTVANDATVTGAGVVPGSPRGYYLSFGDDVDVALAGGRPVPGDEVRLFPADPSATADSVAEFDVEGSNLGDVVLTDLGPII